jgi:hypothetical protein
MGKKKSAVGSSLMAILGDINNASSRLAMKLTLEVIR